MKVEVNF